MAADIFWCPCHQQEQDCFLWTPRTPPNTHTHTVRKRYPFQLIPLAFQLSDSFWCTKALWIIGDTFWFGQCQMTFLWDMLSKSFLYIWMAKWNRNTSKVCPPQIARQPAIYQVGEVWVPCLAGVLGVHCQCRQHSDGPHQGQGSHTLSHLILSQAAEAYPGICQLLLVLHP